MPRRLYDRSNALLEREAAVITSKGDTHDSKFRFLSGAVPDSEDFDSLLRLENFVEDAVLARDRLSDISDQATAVSRPHLGNGAK